MAPADVDVFLSAKQHIRRTQRLQLAVALGVLGLVVLALLVGWDSRIVRGVVYGSMFAVPFIVTSSRTDRVRDRLLDVLERQINSDPEALRYLAAVSRPH